MANIIKCHVCTKPATVHLTQIVNGQVHKVDLCEACAQAKGVTDSNGCSLADLLVKGGAAEFVGGGLTCPRCGYTQVQFKKTGRLGCAGCWQRFGELLEPVLATMHKGTSHNGKVPGQMLERASARDKLSKLRAELQSAIAEERYEDAARCRDRIQQIQVVLQGKPGATDEA